MTARIISEKTERTFTMKVSAGGYDLRVTQRHEDRLSEHPIVTFNNEYKLPMTPEQMKDVAQGLLTIAARLEEQR